MVKDKKRLFIGINLPRGIRSDVFDLQRKLAVYNFPVRFVPRPNLHITIIFLDEQDEWQVEKVKSILRNATGEICRFRVALDKLIVFEGKDKTARLIALNIAVTKELGVLYRELRGGFKKANIWFEEYSDFIPHVTVARFRDEVVLNHKMIRKAFSGVFKKKFVAESIELMESLPDDEGRKYRPIYSVKLKPQDIARF